MRKRTIQIDAMGVETNFHNIRQEELIRCKLYVDGNACLIWTTKANYDALVDHGFFIRNGKQEDCSGAINTTNTYTSKDK